jgi:hypothetical protein
MKRRNWKCDFKLESAFVRHSIGKTVAHVNTEGLTLCRIFDQTGQIQIIKKIIQHACLLFGKTNDMAFLSIFTSLTIIFSPENHDRVTPSRYMYRRHIPFPL